MLLGREDSVGNPCDLAFGLDGAHRDGEQLARVGHVRAAARAAQPTHVHHAHQAATPHRLVGGEGVGRAYVAEQLCIHRLDDGLDGLRDQLVDARLGMGDK